MKIIYCIIFFILFCSCKKNEKEINLTPLIHKSYFSVSENNRKIDSIRNIKKNDSLEILEINVDKRYNENYHIGAIHFLIQDSIKSFYLVNYLENEILMCGNVTPLSKNDSIRIISENIEKIQIAKSIKTNSIIEILKKYQNKIVSKKNQIPLQISFALKNDTLRGSTMYNILQFMAKNKMGLYEIRKMNDDELKRTK